jgi:hypothetical protein
MAIFEGTFGGTKACHILVEKLNRADNRMFTKAVVSRFTKYFETLGELLKLDNPTRTIMIDLWYDETMRLAEISLKPSFEKHGIDWSYFPNIMNYSLRQQKDHGDILEKLRGHDDNVYHAQILYELRMLAKAERENGKVEDLVDETD